MNSLPQKYENFNRPTEILNCIDLAEAEIDYHWSKFEELTLAAQDHLDRHDAAQCRRRQLARQISRVLSQAVPA
jgi:hypothetical protein